METAVQIGARDFVLAKYVLLKGNEAILEGHFNFVCKYVCALTPVLW